MTRSFSMLQLRGFRSHVQRVLAIDAGTKGLKLMLAERGFGKLRILREESIDLQAEGLVSPEELRTHLRTTVDKCGGPPVAIVLPQHLSISQVVDLPLAPESEVNRLIADETIKLSGVSESRIIYDFVRLDGGARSRQQFWVTVSQEGEIRDHLGKLGMGPDEVREVTTTANALIAAYQSAAPVTSRAILLHLGAQTTVVVILLGGQGAFAASFQMGGDFFTRALARLKNCAENLAEQLKRERNFLAGADALPEFAAVVDGWAAELKQQLAEWFRANPGAAGENPMFELVASGGGFRQPGLLDYLKQRANLDLRDWPQPDVDAPAPAIGFEVAFGTALQALGYSGQPVSLLPADYRMAWKKRQARQRIDVASAAIMAACLLALILGTWRQFTVFGEKRMFLEKIKAGLAAVTFNESLTFDLVSEYESLRPILAREQNTIDTLKTFELLTQARTNRNFWCVILSDQQSYFSLPPAALSTNRPARTNLIGPAIEPLRPLSLGSRNTPATLPNIAAAKPGLIAEVCVPGDAEVARAALSELVNGLKQQTLYSKVDLLSDDLRRNLADPKVTVTDRHYVLSLDFAASDFQQPVHWKRPHATNVSKPPKRPTRPSWLSPASGDSETSTAP